MSKNCKKILLEGDCSNEHTLSPEKPCNIEHYSMKFILNKISTTIQSFDVKTLQVNSTDFEINMNLTRNATKSLLPDGSLFYYDAQYPCPFLVDNEFHIKILPSQPIKYLVASAIYFENEIYIIGGALQSISMKYSFENNKWSSITRFPISHNWYTISAVFKNYILIGSIHNSKIIYYDTLIDSYNEISSPNLKAHSCKGFLVDVEAVYLLSNAFEIYRSIDNLMNWNIVGDFSKNLFGCMITSPITYNDKIYFVMSSGIYSFDLKNISIEEVIALRGDN